MRISIRLVNQGSNKELVSGFDLAATSNIIPFDLPRNYTLPFRDNEDGKIINVHLTVEE